MKKRINIILPIQLVKKIQELCTIKGITVTDVIRRALEEYLDNNGV